MKNIFKKVVCMFALVIVATSCGDDDAPAVANQNPVSAHAVEYKLTISAPVLTKIMYTNSEGSEVAAAETLAGVTTWNKTVTISDAPFTAKLQMEAESPAGSPSQYSMQIFVDGVLKHSDSGSALGTSDIELSYEVQ